MNILFIGDIVGKPGRRAVRELLPAMVREGEIDLVVANCENAAGGFGITREVVEDLYGYGVHILTTGNHIWDKKEITDFIGDYETLLRPANYPERVPGRGSVVMPTPQGVYVGVINVMGKVFMPPLDCPFRAVEREMGRMGGRAAVILVDFHGEATSEKMAFGWYMDGRVTAVVGTHTHVQTADERILPKGTAYITDAGMTGPFDSVIGMKKETVFDRFLLQMPSKFDVAKHDVRLQGVRVGVDEKTGRATAIERKTVCL
ncbi:MAG: TIGR00282 family metallophosphoesterase [Syntrophales bacterium]|nr:TIGR00282 family metallophosphoesterase [Syntrophales bacterium]